MIANPNPITNPAEDPDLPLLHAVADGDSQAFDSLYARHGPYLLSFLTMRLSDRQKAEEVLQDVMMAVWRGAARFRGESRVKTWMLTIARNRAVNAYRRRRPQTVPLEEEGDFQGTDTEPLERVARADRGERVRLAIATLPAHHQEILNLVFYQHLSGVEVAQVLGISTGTVKSRLHRAKESLRHTLASEDLP